MNVIMNAIHAGITGFESPAAEYRQLSLSLDELLIEHPSATFIGRADGDSMQNVGIFHNDILIVDRHLIANDRDIIVANFNGEFVCKILDKINKRLLSANLAYVPVKIKEDSQFVIEGVVTRSIRCHREASILCTH